MTNVVFSRQDLAIRGKTTETFNLHQLLFLRASDAASLQTWLAHSLYWQLSHDIQNKKLQLTDNVIRQLLAVVMTRNIISILV